MESITPLRILIALGKKLKTLEIQNYCSDVTEHIETDEEFKVLLETSAAWFQLLIEKEELTPTNPDKFKDVEFREYLGEVVSKYYIR